MGLDLAATPGVTDPAVELTALTNANAGRNHGRVFDLESIRAHIAQPGHTLELCRHEGRLVAAFEVTLGGEIGIVADHRYPALTGRFLLRQLRAFCCRHPILWAVVQSDNYTVLRALDREGFAAIPLGPVVFLLRGHYVFRPSHH